MKTQPHAHAEYELVQLAYRLDHWRQSRATPRARIPQAFWDQAVSLTHKLPVSRVAKCLGLGTTDLKKRCAARVTLADAELCPIALSFVEVTAASAWLSPSAEVELRRSDGAYMHMTYHEPQPPLAALVRTFLETR